jgi:DNA-binding CsgD family transcriptional regulator
MREMNGRGRHARGYRLDARAGERHPLAKLTQEQAAEMRRLSAGVDPKSLALMFGISETQARSVLKGRSYRGD